MPDVAETEIQGTELGSATEKVGDAALTPTETVTAETPPTAPIATASEAVAALEAAKESARGPNIRRLIQQVTEENRAISQRHAESRAELDALKKYLEGGMTDEEKATIEKDRTEALRPLAQEQAISVYMTDTLDRMVKRLVRAGAMEPDIDLLADLKVGHWREAYEAFWEKHPSLDRRSLFVAGKGEQALAEMQEGIEELVQKAREKAIKEPLEAQIRELKEEVAAQKKQAAAERLELQAVSVPGGAGGTGASWATLQQRHRGNPAGMIKDPDYQRLVAQQ